ncbi:two-component system, chemotaxis family, response regulator CheB [Allopseudospirillum japonicum]|uniref:Protein-glutamate methylesterase/protein-glutamine glutaminase n=1 Tax=Allopseudospirillum japonicum TaxID=64971 RepID=A0A1H6SB49_9GAMM|nr:chemotaxis-specific protein-glutamate methyltransferase CheB [Allopseudospirillum japonicum]SEI64046.1 two-component system, chemotaxis family, response regulator CheB [Allopseudospirillum japonicum]
MSIRLLIVDDSALMRKQLRNFFTQTGDFELISARDGIDALEKIKTHPPDVITLDINMPNMDGLTCLSHIMAHHPCPVIMLSSLTEKGALATFEALELGAFDYVSKPDGTMSQNLERIFPELLQKIHAALQQKPKTAKQLRSRLRLQQTRSQPLEKTTPSRIFTKEQGQAKAQTQASARTQRRAFNQDKKLVLIGVSTGGPGTLEAILQGLPANFPYPIVVAQHMPARFTQVFADRLNRSCLLPVQEVSSPCAPEAGHVYIARGDADLRISKRGTQIRLLSVPSHSEYLWHPSVSLMVASALAVYRPQDLICVQLTGMGHDGAKEMAQAKMQGARTLAESEETAVVFGMPRALIEQQGATCILPNHEIAQQLIQWASC